MYLGFYIVIYNNNNRNTLENMIPNIIHIQNMSNKAYCESIHPTVWLKVPAQKFVLIYCTVHICCKYAAQIHLT